MKNKTLIIISGPTASGKTSFAIELAKYFKTEIISADSRQVYKELNIGVALPSDEELRSVKHHFIHSHSIFSPLNAYDYADQALKLISVLFGQHDYLIMAGGSGLFLKAVYHGIDTFPDPTDELRESLNHLKLTHYNKMLDMLEELDPLYFDEVDKKNPSRVQRALEVCITSGKRFSELRSNTARKLNFNIHKFALSPPREKLYKHISDRLKKMRLDGLTDEASGLFTYRHLTPLKSIGYQELFDFFDHKISEDEAYEKILNNTRRYAKKQETWLKKEKGFRFLDFQKTELVRKNFKMLLEPDGN